MICGVHGFIGAALGKALKSRKRAFFAGLITHFFLDLLPHRDFSVKTEAALALAALGIIGTSQGWDSPAFWGAAGAMLPDVENAITQSTGKGQPLFPCHHDTLHGPKVKEVLTQAGIVFICLAALLADESRPKGKNR
jgi:hypothetical protein